MNLKERSIEELDSLPEPIILEVLDFLYFFKAKQQQDDEDLKDARAALATTEGTVAWETLKTQIGI